MNSASIEIANEQLEGSSVLKLGTDRIMGMHNIIHIYGVDVVLSRRHWYSASTVLFLDMLIPTPQDVTHLFSCERVAILTNAAESDTHDFGCGFLKTTLPARVQFIRYLRRALPFRR